QADGPEPSFPRANKQQREAIKTITPDLLASFDAKTTQHNTDVAATVVWKLANNYADMNHVYLTSPIFQGKKTYRSEEHTSELQSRFDLVCRLLLEKKKK